MSPQESGFVTDVIRYARTKPYPEMISFLRGFAELIDGNPEYDAVNRAYQALIASDHQLELIASGQLRLPLDSRAPAKKGHRK